MKRILAALAVTLVCALPSWGELKIHWPLDESSGTIAADTSVAGNDGVWQGSSGAVGWMPAGGIDGGAVDFSGSNSDLFFTDPGFSEVAGTPFTLSAWVKTTSSAKDGMVYLGDGTTGSSYYLMQIQGGNAKTVARNTSEIAATGPDINNNTWHHVVSVYTSATSRQLYVDGELEATNGTSVSAFTPNRFGIGALTRNNPADLFTGQLDDVAAWDRAFSLVDVVALRGLVLLGAGNAAELEDFVAAFGSQSSVPVRGQEWGFASGLAGGVGTTAGSIAGGDASIVLDSSGNGMALTMATEPTITSFSADHPAITPGVPVTLSWQLFNADSAVISGVGEINSSLGSVTVNPAATTTYTITATNGEGSAQAIVTVLVATSAADPRISEFLAKNDSGLQDEDGARPDWIEIHNASGFALDLGGYKLTNDPAVLPMWSFPSLVLGDDEYLVVFASEKNRIDAGATLHTNFTIDADGGYLALVRSDGSTIVQEFAPAFPAQRSEISYSTAGYHSPPTPGEANGGGASSGILDNKVSFDTPGGLFFSSSVNVALSHVDPAATIRYTLDGSTPNESSTAYGSPISISLTTLVKAAVFRAGYVPGPLAQEGYVFAESGLSSFDSELPILVIDTFDTAVPRNDTEFKAAAFAAFDPSAVTGRAALSDAQAEGGNSGVHVRGESSQLGGFNKLNFAFETRNAEGEDKDVSLFGMPEGADWALHASEIDRTFIREQLPHYLFRELGRYSPRTRPVEVFLNQDGGPVSQSDYRGVYLVVERIRRNNDRVDIAKLDPTENTEPDVSGGYIFKRDKSDSGDVRVSTVGEGNFAITYPNEGNVTSAQRDYLQGYLRDFEAALHGASFTDPVTGYAAYIDVQSFVDMHVIQELTKEVDSYVFSTFYYKDRGDKIVCGPLWDFDRSFGNTRASGEENPEGWRGGPEGTRGSFWERLFEDPDFEQLFVDRWQELMESTLAEGNLHVIIDSMADEVDEAKDRNFEPSGPWPLANVTRSHLTFPTYAQHVDYLKDWVSDRLAWVETQFTPKPTFGQPPGVFTAPISLPISATSGMIYYTTDGTDPRAPGGGIAGTAYAGSISISSTTAVTARALDAGEWSGPLSGSFIYGEPASAANLVISEMMYHPASATTAETNAGFGDEEQFEFVELMNIGSNPIELADVVVSEAFDFVFSVTRIQPGGRLLVVRDLAAFEFRYGAGLPVAGEYGESKLSNSGERILITAADGSPIRDFTYGDDAPWPTAADGDGASLHLVNPNSNPEHADPASWRSGGSPGLSGSVPFSGAGEDEFLAYALGADQYSTRVEIVGSDLVFRFPINLAAEGVDYIVETSNDLASWHGDADFLGEIDLGGGAAGREYSVADLVSQRRFIRLRVVQP